MQLEVTTKSDRADEKSGQVRRQKGSYQCYFETVRLIDNPSVITFLEGAFFDGVGRFINWILEKNRPIKGNFVPKYNIFSTDVQ